MKSMHYATAAILVLATLQVNALEINTPKGSTLRAIKMSAEHSTYLQNFDGVVRVRGTYSVQWRVRVTNGDNGVQKQTYTLEVALHPDRRSEKLLPTHVHTSKVQAILLEPAVDMVRKLLPRSEADAILSRSMTTANGEMEAVLDRYTVEVACDRVSYIARIRNVVTSVHSKLNVAAIGESPYSC